MKNTIRVIEHLSYVIECALLGYMGEGKGELGLLIESLKSKESYRIDENIQIANDLDTAFDHYANNKRKAGNSILSSTIRKLWKRIIDANGEFIGQAPKGQKPEIDTKKTGYGPNGDKSLGWYLRNPHPDAIITIGNKSFDRNGDLVSK